MMNHDTLSDTCGGAMERRGMAGTLLKGSAPRTNWSEQQGRVVDDGPMSLLSPVERYNKAIERRDDLVRTRSHR